jgi:hypothetical protein
VSATRALDRALAGFGSLRPANGKTGFNGADGSRFGALRQKSSIFIFAISIGESLDRVIVS